MYLSRNISLGVVCFILSVLCGSAQSITFNYNNFESAKEKALKENKPLFIDTYAAWCTQCKKMDKIFRDSEVGTFFNDKFVNLKVDMGNADYAAILKREFDILFLPTMIILDANGNVKYMVDRTISKRELMDVAKKVANQGVTVGQDVVGLNRPMEMSENVKKAPQKTSKKKAVVEKKPKKPKKVIVENIPLPKEDGKNDKILYVLDDNSNDLPPEVLYQEAYFRMQLMDGSQSRAAKKYLKTQTDWSSEKNMRFISDFMMSTDSDEFRFMIINRHKFEALLGKENVARTIQILVVRKLHQGIPRPTFDEAKALLSYINPQTSRIEAIVYFMERMYQEENFPEYEKYASQYLISVNASDDLVYYRLAKIGANKEQSRSQTEISLDQINKAISINSNKAQYFKVRARLHGKLGSKTAALKSADMSLKLSMRNGESLTEINRLISELKKK